MNSYRDVVGSPMMTMRWNLGARSMEVEESGALCVRTPSGVPHMHGWCGERPCTIGRQTKRDWS